MPAQRTGKPGTAKPAETTTVSPFTFEPTEAPTAKNGAGRKMNPQMAALVDSLNELPMSDPEKREDGWFAVTVPDVSAFASLVRTASNRLGVSFLLRHDVKVTKDKTLNPGTVKIKKIPRRVRGPRKPK